MAQQHFVKKARRDIFQRGTNGSPDTILIAKGEPYYWCKFRYQPKKVSKTPFTSDQLRYGRYGKPEWDEKFSDFENRVNDCVDVEGAEDGANSLREEIEEYRDELQERLDNMPEQLQESSVLNERIEELESLISQLEN